MDQAESNKSESWVDGYSAAIDMGVSRFMGEGEIDAIEQEARSALIARLSRAASQHEQNEIISGFVRGCIEMMDEATPEERASIQAGAAIGRAQFAAKKRVI